jgi:hypothetical protein
MNVHTEITQGLDKYDGAFVIILFNCYDDAELLCRLEQVLTD